MQEIQITADYAAQRLDRFLLSTFRNANRSTIYALLRKKKIKVNKKTRHQSYILVENDSIQLFLPEETIALMRHVPADARISRQAAQLIDIIHEDDEIIVVNKPEGLLTHPDKTEYRKTLTTQIQQYLNHLCSKEFRPAPINRLDKNTTGLVLFAKNAESCHKHNRLMREGKIQKLYQCIVHGQVKKNGEICGYITQDEKTNQAFLSRTALPVHAKAIHTRYTVLENKQKYSLLEVELLTGRTHQIRVSLASIGHPILGDTKYGGQRFFSVTTQCLHAYKIICDGTVFESQDEGLRRLWDQVG
ncbi:MAG: RluA family pseudouridine synthase [Chitinivibrionales bacterium]|nr:RluA family pseudouridine synthase [Chitinivibrionales bacterium]